MIQPEPGTGNQRAGARPNHHSLDVLRGLNSESIDLVYANPPFNSKRTTRRRSARRRPAQGSKDTWTLSDIDLPGTARSGIEVARGPDALAPKSEDQYPATESRRA